MTKRVLVRLLLLCYFFLSPTSTIAVVDPLSVPNNKIGIHVLSPEEITAASKLVNGEKGSWGYVTVPIQATDRDRPKWILFMKQAREMRVIPIVRVATLVNSVHWEEPNNYDLVDFANFLNDLPWPTKNRYVIIFNEVNRADEFGGLVSPERYADILNNSVTIFKERNQDFFILPAGLDNAAATNGQSINWKAYLARMIERQPDILEKVDGWSSHAYPNPAFSGSPYDRHDRSVYSFKHELNFLDRYTDRKLPVFITETGWDTQKVNDERASNYLKISYESVWNDPQVVTVTPFLLQAGMGPFVGFSFVDANGQPRPVYEMWQSQATAGAPELNTAEMPLLLTGGVGSSLVEAARPFRERLVSGNWSSVSRWLTRVLNLDEVRIHEEGKIKVGEKEFKVEYAKSAQERQDGLSGRSRLRRDEGMLFIFKEPNILTFWMKGMKFDIDIVWIRDDKVVDIDRANYREPYKIVSPQEPADVVLEVVPGSGIKVGDVLSQ